MSAESRIVELETRQAFQDDALQALNDVVVEQGRVIERLQLQMAELIKRYEEMVGQYGSEGRRRRRLITEQKQPRGAPGPGGSTAGDRDHVFGLQAFVTMHYRELHTLAFDEDAVAFAAYGTEMDKDIVARITGDETKALGRIEPLDGTGIPLAGVQGCALVGSGFTAGAGKADGQVQDHSERCADQRSQVAHFWAGQQGQRLQDHRHHQ